MVWTSKLEPRERRLPNPDPQLASLANRTGPMTGDSNGWSSSCPSTRCSSQTDVSSSSTVTDTELGEGNPHIVQRELNDGAPFRVVKIPCEPEEVETAARGSGLGQKRHRSFRPLPLRHRGSSRTNRPDSRCPRVIRSPAIRAIQPATAKEPAVALISRGPVTLGRQVAASVAEFRRSYVYDANVAESAAKTTSARRARHSL